MREEHIYSAKGIADADAEDGDVKLTQVRFNSCSPLVRRKASLRYSKGPALLLSTAPLGCG